MTSRRTAARTPAHDRSRRNRRKPISADNPPTARDLRILAVIRRIPRGTLLTYADVARLGGLPGRARLVGFVLRHSPLADAVPWHRVVAAPGRIAPRDGPGAAEQRRRLAAEGIGVSSTGRVNLNRHRWQLRSRAI